MNATATMYYRTATTSSQGGTKQAHPRRGSAQAESPIMIATRHVLSPPCRCCLERHTPKTRAPASKAAATLIIRVPNTLRSKTGSPYLTAQESRRISSTAHALSHPTLLVYLCLSFKCIIKAPPRVNKQPNCPPQPISFHGAPEG